VADELTSITRRTTRRGRGERAERGPLVYLLARGVTRDRVRRVFRFRTWSCRLLVALFPLAFLLIG